MQGNREGKILPFWVNGKQAEKRGSQRFSFILMQSRPLQEMIIDNHTALRWFLCVPF